MLLSHLLLENPSSVVDIVRHTPPWVAVLLLGLLALGLTAARPRRVPRRRLLLLPIVMSALALSGVLSAFGRSAGSPVPTLLLIWLACAGATLALGMRGAPPPGAAYDPASGRFQLPGSWLPLALILAVFVLKYVISVQLVLEPALARQTGFALGVTALYGLLAGLFAARAARVLQLTR